MKMLIIEDAELFGELMRRYLKGLVDELTIVPSWEEAQPYIPHAHIMWVDLLVPGCDEKCAFIRIGEVREENSQMVIFVVSGVVSPGIEDRAKEAGADMFASKSNLHSQNQVIALLISSLLKAQEKGRDATDFLIRARQLLRERIAPLETGEVTT